MSTFNYWISWTSVIAFTFSFVFQSVALVSYARAVYFRLKREHSILKSKSGFGSWFIRALWDCLSVSKESPINLHALWDDLIVLSILVIYWTMCFLALAALFGRQSCSQNNKGAVASYVFAKILIYQVLFERVKVVYQGTMFAYSTTLIRIIKVFSFVSTLTCLILWVLTTKLASRKTFALGMTQCRWQNHSLIMAGIFLIELTNSFTCLGMFTRPLRKLLHSQREFTDQRDENYNSIAATAKRQTILSYMMISSTLTSVILTAVVRSYFSVALDLIVNGICLIMTNNYFGGWYPHICFAPIVIADVCLNCDESGALFTENTRRKNDRSTRPGLSLEIVPSNNPSISAHIRCADQSPLPSPVSSPV